ncbi:DUF2834 domain-containing protein [Kordiimonas aquimaris]|uniref:DUF2834 domain-containing protein n=1 Tax=Kordiimonas aquimaris TaxID=707591 RepID=UPI0021D34783|nr:DUF2834 domain-containing protein [Kordiimonas aquimaris]
MNKRTFESLVILLGAAFTIAFSIIVMPPLIESGDIIGAFAAGFVNPYASGYSLDTIITGLILITWIIYERSTHHVRGGWVAIILCFVPGIAVAFAYYLILRARQPEATV